MWVVCARRILGKLIVVQEVEKFAAIMHPEGSFPYI
jgi:hypothetical protein